MASPACLQCASLPGDVRRAGGHPAGAAAGYHVISIACLLVLWDEGGGKDAAVHSHARDWLALMDAGSAANAALDVALADASPGVQLTGRQVVLTVLAVQARALVALGSSEGCSPAQRMEHLAAALACIRRLLAEDLLSVRHYTRLCSVLAEQGKLQELFQATNDWRQLAVQQQGGRSGAVQRQWVCGGVGGMLSCAGVVVSWLPLPDCHIVCAAWWQASEAAAMCFMALASGAAVATCSRSQLHELLQQCQDANARCRPWATSVLQRLMSDQYAEAKRTVEALEARFPGQELLPVGSLRAAGARRTWRRSCLTWRRPARPRPALRAASGRSKLAISSAAPAAGPPTSEWHAPLHRRACCPLVAACAG